MAWRALAVIGLVAASRAEQPGAALRAGTTLTYEAAGARTEWQIDSVRLDSVPHCGTVWLTRGAAAERRQQCVLDGMLSERQRDGRWTASRPLQPGLERITTRPNGGSVRYRTGAAGVDSISGVGYPVIETEVITFDSTGRAVQRLQERYSIGLTTATWGRFERPAEGSGGWQLATEFRLIRVTHR